MKLQPKVILIIAIAWIIICIVILVDFKLTIMRDYQHLEYQIIDHDIKEIQKAYDNSLSTLILFSQAFSQWDDAYHFMKIKNKKFIDSNFVSGTYTNSRIDFMMYYDNFFQLYYGRTYDSSKNVLLPIPDSLIEYLKHNPNFLSHKSITDHKAGLLNTRNGLIVMTSLPVLTSTGLGPSRGSLLMGYYLKDSFFNNIAQIVGAKLKFFPLSAISSDPLVKLEFSQLDFTQKTSQIALNKNIAYGFILITDINNTPVGVLRIEIPRNVYLQGISTSYHYFIIVIVIGLLVMLLTWYLLKIFVIDRIISISNQITKLNMENEFNQTITVTGQDELNSMINSVNRMMSIIHFSQNRLHYLATHDDLTRLPNRKLFYDLLEKEINQAIDNHSKLAILFIDIDKFKEVNDRYGHAAGDKLLMHVANKIKNLIGATDILARQSGDEFLLCLKNIREIDYVVEITKRIIKSSDIFFKINHQEIIIKLSIGISIFPDDGSTVEELLKNADYAMYAVKAKSGNNYKFYNKNYEKESDYI